jgi:hypothetical protein
MALLRVPIDVLHADAVGKSAAQPVFAPKVLEPFFSAENQRSDHRHAQSDWPASDAAVATLSLSDDRARAILLTQIKTDPEKRPGALPLTADIDRWYREVCFLPRM